MNHSITFTILHPSVLTRALVSDWSPYLRQWAGAVAAVLVAGVAAGQVIQARWQQLLAFPPAWPGGPQWPPDPAPVPNPEPVPAAVLQRQAPASPPVITRRDACRRLRADGLSFVQIGRKLGISRSTVRRELAK